jgi:acyl carrier protein
MTTRAQHEILTRLRQLRWLADITPVVVRGADDDSLMPMSLSADLGLSSLDLCELLLDVEDLFGFEIENDDVRDIRTVRDVVNLIERKVPNG